jgi:hypothetical protein
LADRLAAGIPREEDRVLDPSCGDGALLLAALRRRGRSREFARAGLFGIEVDPTLLRKAREQVAAEAGLATSDLAANIVLADALAPGLRWPTRAHVLANPPWVSFSGRQASPPGTPERARHSHQRRAGWPSLQGAFLTRIARHVAEERVRARVLIPASVADLSGYGEVRTEVTRFARLAEAPEELGENAFPGVREPALLVTLEPRDAAAAASNAAWSCLPELAATLASYPRFPPKTFADAGVHTGNAAEHILCDRPGPSRSPLRRGRDLARYALGPATQYIRTDVAAEMNLRFRVAPFERYISFPALVRQTADRPIAALHTQPGYFRNSLLACRSVPDLTTAVVVAFLNGPVATAWHRACYRDAQQRTFPQVKVSHLAGQPLPFVRRSEAPRLHDELTARVHALLPGEPSFAHECAVIDELTLSAFDLDEKTRAAILAIAARR